MIFSLAEDFAHALDALPQDHPKRHTLELLHGAIRLSTHVLADDGTLLRGQIHGRLAPEQSPGIQQVLNEAAASPGAPWLRPLKPNLMPPGGPLLRTPKGHMHWVNSVVFLPDGRRAASASRDRTLKVWDTDTGECIRPSKAMWAGPPRSRFTRTAVASSPPTAARSRRRGGGDPVSPGLRSS